MFGKREYKIASLTAKVHKENSNIGDPKSLARSYLSNIVWLSYPKPKRIINIVESETEITVWYTY